MEFALYKVVGDEESVLTYFTRWNVTSSSSNNKNNNADWAGAYFQLNASHSIGTLPYRWDQGYMNAKLIKLSCVAPVHVVGDAFMADHNVSGEEKAQRVKRLLGLQESLPLMEQVHGFLLCRENEEEWEMVCRLDNVAKFVRSESVVCLFKRDALTGKVVCRFDSSLPWQTFDELSKVFIEKNFGPNAVPLWADELIKASIIT